MDITYKIKKDNLTAELVKDLYQSSGLNRPDDLKQIQSMIDHANIVITAWHGEKLIGFLRAFTDYCFDCYVNDLAVDRQYQRRGIGKRLLSKLQGLLNNEVMILVVASKEAIDFYPRLGFRHFSDSNIVSYKIVGREEAHDEK